MAAKQLQEVLQIYDRNMDIVSQLESMSAGKAGLFPLTSSIFIDGILDEPNKVLVDLGTGYYADKDLNGAKEFYSRKNKLVQGQLSLIGQKIKEQQNILIAASKSSEK